MNTLKTASKKLLDSAELGDAEGMASALASGAEVDATIKGDRWTAAMSSASDGHEACLSLLIEAGADAGAVDCYGRTPSMLAANNGHAVCLGLLAAAGADFEARADNGWNAAMFAASNGHGHCVEFVIAGGNLDARSNDGETASMVAMSNRHHRVAELLDEISRSRKEAAELSLASGTAPSAGRRAMRI